MSLSSILFRAQAFRSLSRGRLTLAALAVATALSGCTGSAEAQDSSPAGGQAPARPHAAAALTDADWPTYHHDNARTGVAPDVPALGALSRAWSATLDGAVYGQPLVIGNQVFAATENDTVYALDAASGSVVWSNHLGTPAPLADLPCGNIDPLGITSTMVYDPATDEVFALAEMTGGQHVLFGLDAGTGQTVLRRPAEPPLGSPVAHQQRAALNLLDGWVYIAYGGLAGDCSQYIGSVVGVPTTGDGALRTYAVPTTREGGIWATGGAAVVDGQLLYAVGNGESVTTYDGSDSVIALTPELTLADRFAPSTWVEDNRTDLDLGSMTPAVSGDFVFADGKRGIGYTLGADNLGDIGGEVAQAQICRAFGGSAVNDGVIYVPCSDGTRAVTLSGTGTPSVRWRAPVRTAKGSPVVGGGAVWVIDYDAGVLYAFDEATGATRQQISVGRSPHFASPTLVGEAVYVGTLTGVVAISGA